MPNSLISPIHIDFWAFLAHFVVGIILHWNALALLAHWIFNLKRDIPLAFMVKF
jgi:hypothetical protein